MSSSTDLIGFAPDSVYAEYTPEQREIADRGERDGNSRHATILARLDEDRSHPLEGCSDDSLRRLRKRHLRDLEDIADADLADSKNGYRSRMLRAQVKGIETLQDVRAALRESWLASEDGTHCFTSYAARGGLDAVTNFGATPPNYDLALRLDRRNAAEGKPCVLDWDLAPLQQNKETDPEGSSDDD